MDEDILRIGKGPYAVEVDIMQPIDPEKAPKVHEPKLNHIGLWIDDLPKAVEWLTAQGVRFTPGGIRKGAAGYDVCFIHPKGNEEFPLCSEGVLVELVQAPEEVIGSDRVDTSDTDARAGYLTHASQSQSPNKKPGKLIISRRYNRLPLLPSGPGGIQQELAV